MPKVSVLLPVYNGLPYLGEAIESVLTQTFADFELIIIDDGSTDGSASVLGDFTDPRIHLYQQPNSGLPATLNRGIALARGEYIARQDQDDVSFPERFARQVAFLDGHRDVAMVGACAQIWEGAVCTARTLCHPAQDAELRFELLFDNPFIHSSVMIRRTAFEQVGVYSLEESRLPPEDYELWSRLMKVFQVANLPDILLAYREIPGSMSRTGSSPFRANVINISAENLAWATGLSQEHDVVRTLAMLSQGAYEGLPRDVSLAQMAEVMAAALQRIARMAGVPASQLDELRRVRMRRLRYRYWDAKSGGLLSRASGRMGLRRLFRRGV